MLVRHIGTAGMTWGGLTIRHRKDIDPHIWVDLGVSILCGAIVPTILTFFSQRGLPEQEINVTASGSSRVVVNPPQEEQKT